MSRFAPRALTVGLALVGSVLLSAGLPLTSSAEAPPPAPLTAPLTATAAAQAADGSGELGATAALTPVAPARTSAARVRTAPEVPVTAAARVTASRTRTVSTPDVCSGSGWQQRRGEAALRSLRPAAPTTWDLRFLGARDGFYGLAKPASQVVEVYVRSCSAQTSTLLRHVLAHELGHAHDVARMTDARRAEWKRLRGIPQSSGWFGCNRCTDFATPAGDFAEVYAQWRRGASTNRSEIGDAPSAAALEVLAQRFFLV